MLSPPLSTTILVKANKKTVFAPRPTPAPADTRPLIPVYCHSQPGHQARTAQHGTRGKAV